MAADLGIAIVTRLLEAIGSEVIKEVCDMWDYKSHLEELNETVSTIRKVLLAAEAKRELSVEEQDFIEKLKEAVYDADDLFDEFLTLAELKQLRPLSKRGRFFEKVRCFFSSKNQLGQAHRMSRDVKVIKKRLEDIADTHTKFKIIVDYRPISRRRDETYSYVTCNEIIGREKDKETIINMLLDHDNNQDLYFLTIVGVGGMGKTALAQLVYNDEKITKEFPEMKLWVCVSDQGGEQFDVKTILCKILELVVGQKFDSSFSMERVQHLFQERLRGKKYLLVLDDVWNEDRNKWVTLKNFLMLGEAKSKVIVTTRSERTGKIIDDKHVYKLDGLSQENSWLLFEKWAFDEGDKCDNHHEFVEIGMKIVKKCYNVPLAIKVVGSLLFGQGISKWRSFENGGLANISKGDNEILSILKLSYHNLAPSLKSCFRYTAMFPKDYRIKKQTLIDEWMAQGYIMPFDENQSMEDAAEEHFLILLRRCFFQDVEKDVCNNIMFVKIHDLLHDVAQEVGREEISIVTCDTKNVGDKVRHIHFFGHGCLGSSLDKSKIRSFISCLRCRKFVVDTQIKNWICLRTLSLCCSNVSNFPDSLGYLLHLRYLSLSNSKNLEVLPETITRLHNLQTLLLSGCSSLRELPQDFCKLVKLRHLNLLGCENLVSMPSEIDKLTSLVVVPYFMVGMRSSATQDELKALEALTGIRGGIEIDIGGGYKVVEDINNNKGGGYLKSKKYLTKVTIMFRGGCTIPEAVLEVLEPPSNVKELCILGYEGMTILEWGRAVDDWALSMTNLVQIKLQNCINLQEMPVLSKLPFLKRLELINLVKLEYMETSNEIKMFDIFFPSLEYLHIERLEKLKGWWKESSSNGPHVGVDDHCFCCFCSFMWEFMLKFPTLCVLLIVHCPNLASFPPCPTVETLRLINTDKVRLQIAANTANEDDDTLKISQVNVRLSLLEMDNTSHLMSLPINYLRTLDVLGDEEIGEVETRLSEVFDKCASSLHTLRFFRKNNLWRLCQRTGLQHFLALRNLLLAYEDEFEDDDSSLILKSFPPNLHSLVFDNLNRMTSLPLEMRCLTSLQFFSLYNCMVLKELPEWISCFSSLKSLFIQNCPALKSLPDAVQKLTSLESLIIRNCPELIERCKQPSGEDCHKIQHIPRVVLRAY